MLSILDLKPEPDQKRAAKPPSQERAAPETETSSAPTTPLAPANEPAKAATANERASSAPSPPKSPEPVKKSGRPALSTESIPVSEPVNIPVESEPKAAPEAIEQSEFELVVGRRQIASWLFVGTLLIAAFSAAAYYAGRLSAQNCLADLRGQSVPYVAPALPVATIVPPGQAPELPAGVAPTVEPGSSTAAASAPLAASVGGSAAASATTPTQPSPASVSNPAVPSAASSTAAPSAASVTAPTAASATASAQPVRDNNAASSEPPLFANPQPGALYLQMGAVDKGIAIVLAEGLRRHGFNSLVAPGPSEKIFRVLIGPFATQEQYKRAKAEVDAIDLSTFARRFQK